MGRELFESLDAKLAVDCPEKEFLKQLFTRPQTRHHDLDITLRICFISHTQPRKLNHTPGKLHDFDRDTHVEYEN